MDAGEGWTSHRDDQRHRLPDRPRGLAAGRRCVGVGLGQPRSVGGSPGPRLRRPFPVAAPTGGANRKGLPTPKTIDARGQAGGASRLRVRAAKPSRLHASLEDGDVMLACA